MESPQMKQYFFSHVIFFTALCINISNIALANESTDQITDTKVSYNKTTNLISIDAKDTTLKHLLKKISHQSSLEVLFDDDADEAISITLKDQPLSKAINNILRGKNHLLQFTATDTNKKTLTSVIVLPAGKSDTKGTKRLNSLNNEALYQASRNLSLEQSNKIDRALERWSARLNRLPLDKRQELEYRAKKRVIAQENAKKRNGKRIEARKAQEEKHAQFINNKRNERYQHLGQEEIHLDQQREQNIRNEMKGLILPPVHHALSN